MATVDIGILITAIDKATAPFRRIAGGMTKLGGAADKLRPKLRAIHVVLLSIATGSGLAFTKRITKVVGEMESLFIRLARVEGGFRAGDAVFKRLLKTYSGAPVQLDAIADGFVRMRAAGMGTQDVEKILKGVVNAVVAFGGSTEEVKRATIGMSQVLGKGVLQMEELRQQLGEAIPGAMIILADAYKMSVSEFISAVSKGNIEAFDSMKKLGEQLKRIFGGSIETMSNTLLGKIQNLKNKLKIALFDAFERNTTGAKQMAELIDNLGNKIERFIRSINQSDVDAFFGALNTGVDVIVSLVNEIGNIISGIKDFIVGIGELAGDIVSLFDDTEGKAEKTKDTVLRSLGNIAGGLKWGAIGFFLFGIPGFIIGTLVALLGEVKSFMNQVSTSSLMGKLGDIPKGFEPSKRLKDAIAEARRVTALETAKGGFTGLFLSDEARARVERNIAEAKNLLDRELTMYKKHAAEIRRINGKAGALTPGEKRLSDLSGEEKDRIKKRFASVTKTLTDALTDLNRQAVRTGDRLIKPSEREIRKLEVSLNKVAVARKQLAQLEKTPGAEKAAATVRRALQGAEKDIQTIRLNIKNMSNKELAQAGTKAANIADQMKDRFGRVTDVIEKLKAKFAGGDGLTNAIAGMNKQFNDSKRQLEEVAERAIKLGDKAMLGSVARAMHELERLRGVALKNLQREYDLKNKITVLDIKRQKVQIDAQLDALKRDADPLSGLLKSDAVSAARDKILGFKTTVLRLDAEIYKQQIKMTKAKGDEKDAIGELIDKMQMLRDANQEAMSQTTALGEATKTFWENIGSSISSSIASGLKDLITGAKSAKEVLLDLYDKITQAAIEYLIELTKIILKQLLFKAISAATGSPAGGPTGGGFAGGGGGGFANGGIFDGAIRPFSKGGIIQKPMMFGIAGEGYKKEAIMPLEQVGGKLGVRATGGGETIQPVFQINAIDTQSGMEFLMKNADMFANVLNQRRMLNKGR